MLFNYLHIRIKLELKRHWGKWSKEKGRKEQREKEETKEKKKKETAANFSLSFLFFIQ